MTNYIEFVNEKVNGDRIGEIYWKLLPDAIESVDLLEGIDRKQLKIIIKNSIVQGSQCPKSLINSIEWFEINYPNKYYQNKYYRNKYYLNTIKKF